MKFIVSSSVLQKQLSVLSGVIMSNPIVPILENFLIEIKDGKLIASASDLHISMTTELPIETTDNGSIAIPAKILLETLKSLPEQPVTFLIDEENLSIEITSYKGRYKLTCENAEDFPKIPQPDADTTINMSSEVLAQAIQHTLFAVGTDELRPAMTGMFVQLEQDKTTFVATDGNRLIKYLRNDVKSTDITSMIIPKKALSLLKATLPSEIVEVEAQFNSANAFFSFGDTKMVCRLIDEKYPDYEKAIPLNNENKMIIDRNEILNSLKRLIIYANKTTNQVRLKLAQSTLQIFAEDLDFSNEAQETLISEYNGEEMEIGFNARYLIEMLSNLTAKEVTFTFSTPSRACILLPNEKAEEEEVLLLIMPVMLSTYA